MKKILLLATYDSFLKTGLSIANAINIAEIDIYIRTTAANQISKKQLESIYDGKDYFYKFFFMDEYRNIDYNKYDIIILSAGNEFIKSFFAFFLSSSSIDREKIITISLFPGVIFGDIDSIAARMNVDILLCNNQIDYDIAKSIQEKFNFDNEILLYGFPIIKEIKKFREKRDKIYFFEQVKIPEEYTDRYYLVKKLVEYAEAHPHEVIYIKPRVRLDEKTVHINKYPLEKILKTYASKNTVPENLFFTYDSIEECFSDMKLGLTISSTVAIEAMYYHIPMGLISDFGIRKEFANQDFLESGCLISFDEIGKKEPNVNDAWYKSRISFPSNRNNILNSSIEKKLINPKNRNSKFIGLESIEYFNYKKGNYVSKNRKRFLKAIKNPMYTLSVIWNFVNSKKKRNSK